MFVITGFVPAPDLTREELWQGLLRKARNPLPYVEAITECRVVKEEGAGFVREIVVRGERLQERITHEPKDRVLFRRLSGRAWGTIENRIESDDTGRLGLRFTFSLELKDERPGSAEEQRFADRMERSYLKAVDSTIAEIRRHRAAAAGQCGRTRAGLPLLLLLLAIGCSSVTIDPALRVAGAQEQCESAAPQSEAGPTPLERWQQSAEQAVEQYDGAELTRLCAEMRQAFERRDGTLEEYRLFGRASLHLAEIWKFRSTVVGNDGERDKAVKARLEVARKALPAVEGALEVAPQDGELHFLKGELNAYLIDGFLSGMKLGPVAQQEGERAVELGAGPYARLALAKRYFYLPKMAGGDLDKAEREIRRIIKDQPQFEPAWGFLGMVLKTRGRDRAATSAFRRAVALNPHSLRGRFFLDNQLAKVER